jgi:D-3-phosphoglycerate dehydrogenase
MDVQFREAWLPGDLAPDPQITVWVPNPGQNFTVTTEILDLFPALSVIATPSTGRNHIDEAACSRKGVTVFSLQDDRATLDSITASAEFTFLLLLNALRRLDFAVGEVTEDRWRSREDMLRGRELAGMQVGIVGLGRNGGRMARYCQAFEAAVAYYDPYVSKDDLPRWPLERIFSESQAVVVCCALTTETTDMIGIDLLKTMRQGAVLVNTSRGELIVESELAEVLAERADLRVGLDVIQGEVTNTHGASPLLGYHRSGQIVVTPHIAGATVDSQSKAALGSLNALAGFLAGAPARVD